MFPLAHNFLARRLLNNPAYNLQQKLNPLQIQLLLLGSVMPDLVSGMGMDRNFGHTMGKDLYAYCEKKYPDAIAFALGVWLHGADPCGFDYYADESWQGQKGWCFQKCVPYIDDVIKACNLPQEWGLWKAHNFIEMMADRECSLVIPDLGSKLLDAAKDQKAISVITEILTEFGGAEKAKVKEVIDFMDQMFSINDTSPEDMGEKYAKQLVRRHEIYGANPQMIADIIKKIAKDLKDEFWQWYQEAEKLLLTEMEKQNTILNYK